MDALRQHPPRAESCHSPPVGASAHFWHVLLQTRSGKRTAKAALRIAVDMVGEGLITEAEAATRLQHGQHHGQHGGVLGNWLTW